jgi:hypothetical protein
MTEGPSPAKPVRRPPGTWARRHIVQMVTAGAVLLLICACCNPLAWPTLVWRDVGHDCGAVRLGVASTPSPGATQAETCFAQAYHRCSAATLSASFVNVDYGASYSFVIEPYGFTCAVGVIAHMSGAHNPFSGIPGVGYCGGMRLEANGLRMLDCQSIGDVFVPGGA